MVSFGAGSVILGWLAGEAARAGVHLIADFRPTERNRMMEVAYRFAGFTGEPCDCRAGLAPPREPGVERLHLLPEPHDPPPTMELHAPRLA